MAARCLIAALSLLAALSSSESDESVGDVFVRGRPREREFMGDVFIGAREGERERERESDPRAGDDPASEAGLPRGFPNGLWRLKEGGPSLFETSEPPISRTTSSTSRSELGGGK